MNYKWMLTDNLQKVPFNIHNKICKKKLENDIWLNIKTLANSKVNFELGLVSRVLTLIQTCFKKVILFS